MTDQFANGTFTQNDTLTLTTEEHGVRLAASRSAGRRASQKTPRFVDDAPLRLEGRIEPRDHTDSEIDWSDGGCGEAVQGTGRISIEPAGAAAHMSREEQAVARLRRIADTLQSGVDRQGATCGRPAWAGAARGGETRMSGPTSNSEIDWAAAEAPSAEAIEAIAAEAYAALPPTFRSLCDSVAILVRDFADEEVLQSLGVENAFDLMGLYEGVELTAASGHDVPQDLNRIFLYRRPILDYWLEHHESLGAVITHVLVHEIGHHFGLSDDDMEAIERSVG